MELKKEKSRFLVVNFISFVLSSVFHPTENNLKHSFHKAVV